MVCISLIIVGSSVGVIVDSQLNFSTGPYPWGLSCGIGPWFCFHKLHP